MGRECGDISKNFPPNSMNVPKKSVNCPGNRMHIRSCLILPGIACSRRIRHYIIPDTSLARRENLERSATIFQNHARQGPGEARIVIQRNFIRDVVTAPIDIGVILRR